MNKIHMLIQMDEQILIQTQNVYMWHTIVNTEADTVCNFKLISV